MEAGGADLHSDARRAAAADARGDADADPDPDPDPDAGRDTDADAGSHHAPDARGNGLHAPELQLVWLCCG
ncbi:MAG TPA: hypothetical protein VNN74_02090 [Candidatus Micrarchaeia archaeon]|nr:hypothetical protein [Candidatus Micrarchaeia archaeon]